MLVLYGPHSRQARRAWTFADAKLYEINQTQNCSSSIWKLLSGPSIPEPLGIVIHTYRVRLSVQVTSSLTLHRSVSLNLLIMALLWAAFSAPPIWLDQCWSSDLYQFRKGLSAMSIMKIIREGINGRITASLQISSVFSKPQMLLLRWPQDCDFGRSMKKGYCQRDWSWAISKVPHCLHWTKWRLKDYPAGEVLIMCALADGSPVSVWYPPCSALQPGDHSHLGPNSGTAWPALTSWLTSFPRLV